MLFQAVLFTVIAYLVACYAYGMYLLWKLYVGRKFHEQLDQVQNPMGLNTPSESAPQDESDADDPSYSTPAKAA